MTHDIAGLEKRVRGLDDWVSKLHDRRHGERLASIIRRPGWTSVAEFALVQAHVEHLEQQVQLLHQTLDSLIGSAEQIGHLNPIADESGVHSALTDSTRGVVGTLSLSEEEHGRAVRMAADVLDLISAKALLVDGYPDEETKARLLDRSKEALNRLDVSFVLDLADRLGEDALRAEMERSTPPSARPPIDTFTKVEGGILPLLKNRINRIRPGDQPTFAIFSSQTETSFGCGLGAAAVVMGVAINQTMGGFTAVVGIVTMAKYC